MKNLCQSVLWLFLGLGILLSSLVLHEGGHALTAIAFGEQVESFSIFPGIQLYPKIEWQGWNTRVAAVNIPFRKSSAPQRGLIGLMGSGTTTLTAYLATIILLTHKPPYLAQKILVLIGLWFPLDMIAYAVFPSFGLPHFLIIGGQAPEPALSAEALGIPPTIFFLALTIGSFIFYGILARYIFRSGVIARLKTFAR